MKKRLINVLLFFFLSFSFFLFYQFFFKKNNSKDFPNNDLEKVSQKDPDLKEEEKEINDEEIIHEENDITHEEKKSYIIKSYIIIFSLIFLIGIIVFIYFYFFQENKNDFQEKKNDFQRMQKLYKKISKELKDYKPEDLFYDIYDIYLLKNIKDYIYEKNNIIRLYKKHILITNKSKKEIQKEIEEKIEERRKKEEEEIRKKEEEEEEDFDLGNFFAEEKSKIENEDKNKENKKELLILNMDYFVYFLFEKNFYFLKNQKKDGISFTVFHYFYAFAKFLFIPFCEDLMCNKNQNEIEVLFDYRRETFFDVQIFASKVTKQNANPVRMRKICRMQKICEQFELFSEKMEYFHYFLYFSLRELLNNSVKYKDNLFFSN